jgi:hypothetical protein
MHRPLGLALWDSVPMLPLGGSFIGTIPGLDVTEVGLEFFVSVENSNVQTTDPPGAPADSVFEQGVERPWTFETQAQPTSRSDFLVGRDINVEVTLPQGAEFVSGNLHYREGGQTESRVLGRRADAGRHSRAPG